MRASLVAVAPISMKLVTLAARRRSVQRLIQSAASSGAKLVCFPEYVDVRRSHEAVKLAQPLKGLAPRFAEGPFAAMIHAAAAQCRIGVVYGQCAWVGEKLLNLTVSVDTRGRIMGTYAKTHLAPGENSEDGVDAGKKIGPLPTVLGPAGVVTCYEVLFPEIARTLHARGARFLIVPTAGSSDQYFALARARAIENQMPMIFSSYSTERGQRSDDCGAAIVDFAGKVLVKTTHGRKVLTAEIDLDAPRGSPLWHGRGPIVDLRAFAWKGRRPRLYKG